MAAGERPPVGSGAIAQGWVRRSQGEYRITNAGKRRLLSAARVNADIETMADLMMADDEWVRALIEPGGELHREYRAARAELKVTVHKIQLAAGATNAAGAKLLGKQVLGQTEEPAPKEGPAPVLGAVPEYTEDPSDWIDNHKPKESAGSTIERLRALTQVVENPSHAGAAPDSAQADQINELRDDEADDGETV